MIIKSESDVKIEEIILLVDFIQTAEKLKNNFDCDKKNLEDMQAYFFDRLEDTYADLIAIMKAETAD